MRGRARAGTHPALHRKEVVKVGLGDACLRMIVPKRHLFHCKRSGVCLLRLLQPPTLGKGAPKVAKRDRHLRVLLPQRRALDGQGALVARDGVAAQVASVQSARPVAQRLSQLRMLRTQSGLLYAVGLVVNTDRLHKPPL